MRKLCFFLLTLSAILVNVSAKLSCKDEENNDVDWWFKYLQDDAKYFYVTSENYGDWQMSDKFESDYRTVSKRTLDSLVQNEKALLAAYNDVFPNGTEFNWGGSAKGVIASDGETGVWLVHSKPRYPRLTPRDWREPREPEDPKANYANSFLCLTLDAAGVEQAAELLLLYQPHFYYIRNPLDKSKLPQLQRALAQQWNTTGLQQLELQLSTLGGKQIKLFGKHPSLEKEIYADIVAPALNVNLFVKSHQEVYYRPYPPEVLPNSCNGNNKVYNVEEIVSPKRKYIGTSYDESKFAVSQEKGFMLLWMWRMFGNDFICIGDLDRHHSHQKRGGGAICMKSARVSERYRSLLYRYEECVCETYPCTSHYQ